MDYTHTAITLLMYADNPAYKLPLALIGVALFCLGLQIMHLVGDNVNDTDDPFGSNHERYWRIRRMENGAVIGGGAAIFGFLLVACALVGTRALQTAILGCVVTDAKQIQATPATDYAGLVRRGDAAWANLDSESALQYYTTAISLAPRSPLAYRKRADVESLMGHEQDAQKDRSMAHLLRGL